MNSESDMFNKVGQHTIGLGKHHLYQLILSVRLVNSQLCRVSTYCQGPLLHAAPCITGFSMRVYASMTS